jgi:ribosomal protein S6--L-glutamate ligase
MTELKLAIIYGEISTKHQLIMQRAEGVFDSVLAAPVDGLKMVHNGDGHEVVYKGTDLTEFDAVYIRTDDADKAFSEHLSEVLEKEGVATQAEKDTYAYESNKFYSMKILRENGVDVPDSVYTLSPDTAVEAAESLEYPVIMKTIGGGGGDGVMRAPSESELKPVMDTMKAFEQDICLQEFLEEGSTDFRVLVIGDFVAAYKRSNEDEDEWRSNFSTGGNVSSAELDPETRDAALKAAASTGFDICGCDVVQTASGPEVLEINGSFGIRERYNELVGEDVAFRIVDRMHELAVQNGGK